MLKVLGRCNSSNVQKVLWCLDELGLPFEREDVGGPFGRNRDPEYLALNPNGLIPTVIDEGRVLWESNAILRYLAASYDTAELWEPDPGRRAGGEKWMDWQLSVLAPPMTPLFVQLVRTTEAQRDEALVAKSMEKATTAFRILDDALQENRWLGGDRFTVADMPCGVLTYRWLNLPVERPPLPALEDWYARLAGRRAYQRQVMTGLS